MKVFLSWSGEHSRQVAAAVMEWLPLLINEVEPFMSSSIEAGTRWQAEISAQLEETDFGILFVTAENQTKPWLNFEAGALAKSVTASHVVPLAIDLGLADIKNPLAQFQAQRLDELGVRSILKALNSVATKPLSDAILDKQVAKWWPDLHEAVSTINSNSSQAANVSHERPERDILEELLSTVRGIARTQRDLPGPAIQPLDHQLATPDLSGENLRSRNLIRRVDGLLDKLMIQDHEVPEWATKVDRNAFVIMFPAHPNAALRNEIQDLAAKLNVPMQIVIDPRHFNKE